METSLCRGLNLRHCDRRVEVAGGAGYWAQLSEASLKLMRTPTALPDGTVIDYGLGTRLGLLEKHRVLGHTGSGGGFAGALESFPDDHLAVVVLVNTEIGATPL